MTTKIFLVRHAEAEGNLFRIAHGQYDSIITPQGYRQLAGGLSKRGAVICVIILMAVIAGANQINCTMEVIETVDALRGWDFVEVFGAYEEIPEVREIQSRYQGHLLVLYLFCLLGSLPILVRAFRKPRARTKAELEEILLGKEEDPEEDPEKPELQGTLYPFRKSWMKPVRISAGGAAVALLVVLVVLMMLTPRLEERFEIRLEFGMIAGIFLSFLPLLWISLTITRYCNVFQILYVRAAGRLWRVNLMKLCRVGDWEALPPARQTVVRDDILWELENILEGDFSAVYSGAVTELRDIQAEKEDRWSWTCFYESEDGKRKTLRIGKGYPDFCPAFGLERPLGPVPARWTAPLFSVALAAAIIAGFWAVNLPITFGSSPNPSPTPDFAPEADTQPDAQSIPARVPENITEYEMSEVWFQVDSAFKYSQRTFLDGDTGTLYRAYVQYGVDIGEAWDTLSQYIGKYHASPLFDRFDAAYLEQDMLTPLHETSRYNIVSVYLTDGQVFHTAAVLSDDGALFTMEAEQSASDRSEDVLANLMFTLESVRFDGPVVTEENYQSQIHVSEVRDCSYMAAAYLKTDLFGHDAFVDVYVPYSDSPIYSAGGRAIRTEAHGLRVYATIVPGENAQAVVKEAGNALGYAAAAVSSVVNPEIILLGGGVSAAGSALLGPVEASFKANVLSACAGVRFALAQLGNNAGIYGGAALFFTE